MAKTTKTSGAAERSPLLLANGQTMADPEVMRKALKLLDVAVAAKAKPEELIGALRATIPPLLKKIPKGEHMVCDDCGEVSTDATDFCPFCGSTGETEKGDDAQASAAPKGKGAAIEKSTDASLAEKGKQLDEIVERIEVLKKDAALNSYDLGVELKKLQVGDLWKARKSASGQAYASFKEFLEAEVGMSRQSAYLMMDLTENWDRETFERVGPSKLKLIASVADEEKRQELLDEAKNGASKRTIERKSGKASSSGPAKAAPAAAPAKQDPNAITLLTKVGGKAETHPFRSVESKRALKAYDPEKPSYVEVQLSDDVVLHLALKVEKDGSISGVSTRFLRVE